MFDGLWLPGLLLTVGASLVLVASVPLRLDLNRPLWRRP